MIFLWTVSPYQRRQILTARSSHPGACRPDDGVPLGSPNRLPLRRCPIQLHAPCGAGDVSGGGEAAVHWCLGKNERSYAQIIRNNMNIWYVIYIYTIYYVVYYMCIYIYELNAKRM